MISIKVIPPTKPTPRFYHGRDGSVWTINDSKTWYTNLRTGEVKKYGAAFGILTPIEEGSKIEIQT